MNSHGISLISFNLHPMMYQPSGTVNISNASNFYLDFSIEYPKQLVTKQYNVVLVELSENLTYLQNRLMSDIRHFNDFREVGHMGGHAYHMAMQQFINQQSQDYSCQS